MDLDELGVVLAEDIMTVIEAHTHGDLIDYDEDIASKVNELAELIVEKYTTFREEEFDEDTEFHGDMDDFEG